MKILCLLLVLLATVVARAQTTAPLAKPVDTILRTDGQEVTGHVLTITPLELRYLSETKTDTLRLPADEVFLVRFANGTREVLHPLAPLETMPPDPLPGLTVAERRYRGRYDASRCYRDSGPFWAALGSTLYLGPLAGVAAPVVMAPRAVKTENLAAPHPEQLTDFAYDSAYRQEAQRRKRGRAWGGYAVGAGVWAVLLTALASGGQ